MAIVTEENSLAGMIPEWTKTRGRPMLSEPPPRRGVFQNRIEVDPTGRYRVLLERVGLRSAPTRS